MGTAQNAAIKPECLICGARNPAEAVICAECSAPMALVHNAAVDILPLDEIGSQVCRLIATRLGKAV